MAIAATGLAACGSSDNSGSSKTAASPSAASDAPAKALAALEKKVLSPGPYGEKPVPASSISFTADELQKVRDKHATAAIVLHYGGNDWSTAQVDGIKKEFTRLGVKVIAVTDANFKPDKQVSDIETVLARKPDIIVSIPTDPVATADAYKKAADQGVKLVFMGQIPKGLKPGPGGYVSVVSADDAGNGAAAAHLMAEALTKKNGSPKGKIGLIYHAAVFPPTNQRYDSFKKTIKDYPNVQVIAQKGIAGPDFAGDAEKAANAMLTQHPDLDGIWAVWDVPAEGVMAAARSAGRNDLIITTCDLGLNVAIDMARGGLIKGVGAQKPFDQGIKEADMAGYSLIGKKAPPYVAVTALPVAPAGTLKAWDQVYHAPPPKTLAEAAK